MTFERVHDLLEAYRDVLSLPTDMLDTETLSELAAALEAKGHVREAIAALEVARLIAPDDEELQARSLALFGQATARIDESLRWLAAISAPLVEPDPSVVLIIGGESLPFSEGDSGQKLHSIALRAKQAGFSAHVVSLLPHPWNLRLDLLPMFDEIDGVAYHRLLPFGPTPASSLALLAANIDALAPLVARLRPATLHALPGTPAGLVAHALARWFGLTVIYEPELLESEPAIGLRTLIGYE